LYTPNKEYEECDGPSLTDTGQGDVYAATAGAFRLQIALGACIPGLGKLSLDYKTFEHTQPNFFKVFKPLCGSVGSQNARRGCPAP